MAGGDVTLPPGFTSVDPDQTPSVVRRPPQTGAPPTDVQALPQGLPPGFTPVTPGGTTTAPVPAPEASSIPQKDPTWSEALGAMVTPKKYLEDARGMAQDIVEGGSKAGHAIVSDPLGTAGKVAKYIGKSGAQNLVAPGAGLILPFVGPKTKEAMNRVHGMELEPNPIVQQLVDSYGSGEKIRKSMYNHPLGTLLDVATAAAGGESLIARTGLSTLRGAETAGKVLGGVARLDPITLASRGTPGFTIPGLDFKVPGIPGLEAGVSKLVPERLGGLSGVGPEVTRDIRDLHNVESEAGKFYGDQGRKEFQDAFTGKVKPQEVVDRAEEGISNLRKDANLGYKLNADEWKNAGGKLDMSVIDKTERDMVQSLHTSGGSSLLSEAQRESFNKMQEIIEEFRKRGPGGWTVEEMDALKRNLNKINVPLGDRELLRVRTGLSNSVKDNILANASGTKYHNSMRQYQAAMNDLDEMKGALSLGKDAPAHTVMSKLQSILRNNAATQYGMRQGLFDLLEKEGGVQLKPWLLGMATNVDNPRGITGAISKGSLGWGAAGAGAGFASGLGPVGSAILGTGTAAAEAASRSPRVAAKVSRHIGEHGGQWSDAFPLLRYGPIAVGKEDQQEDERKKQGRARGGRIGYADGGEVMDDEDAMAAMSSISPSALGRVKRSYFTPIGVTGQKLAPSKAIMGNLLPANLPKLPEAGGASPGGDGGGGGLMDNITKLWNAPFDQKRAQEKTAEIERLKQEALDLAKANAAKTAAAAPGAAPQPGTTTGGGVLQATPIAGDSYEAKVGSFESGGKDDAKNPSGASGRYQFMPSTAEGIIKAHPELNISANWRTNADDQKKLMSVYTDTSREILRKALGRDPTGGELYALHLFGQGKGPSIVSGGSAPLAGLTSEAERSGNPFLNNFKTAGDLINYFNKRFG